MAFAHCGEYEEDILGREARNPELPCRLFGLSRYLCRSR